MNMNHKIGRRTACAAMVGGGLLAAGTAHAQQRPRIQQRVQQRVRKPLAFKNADFYDAEGKFKEEAAKAAYLELLRFARYPVSDNLRENMWVADFGLGNFTEVGLAGMFWVNDQKWNYTSLEMFLLPNQMVPEHWHVAVVDQKVPAKMESWHVRWGKSYTYGEGDPTKDIAVKMHEAEKKHISVFNETILGVGEVTGIKKQLEVHWQQAGRFGAIITESSTFHTGDAVRFTNPNIVF